MLSPNQVVSAALQPGTYITDGLHIPSSQLIAFATSSNLLKVYNAATGSFVRDIAGHNGQITDLASFGVAGQSSVLISSQRDTGLMISDLRDRSASPCYLTELQRSGLDCFSVAVSPSGNTVALAAGTDVHILDPRQNFRSLKHIPEVHSDVISRLRFVTDSVLVSGGEDMMFNISNIAARREDDLLLSSSNWGQAANRISVLGSQFITATGSCEGSLVQPIPAFGGEGGVRLEEADWPLELKVARPPLGSYLVDFVPMSADGSEIAAVVGERPAATEMFARQKNGLQQTGDDDDDDDDQSGNGGGEGQRFNNNNNNNNSSGDHAQNQQDDHQPQRAALLRVTRQGVQPTERIQLAPTHRDDIRCVVSVGEGRIITAGEDGVICYWDLSGGNGFARQQQAQRKPPVQKQRHDDEDDDEIVVQANANPYSNEDGAGEKSGSNSSSSSGGGKEIRNRGTKNRLAAVGQPQQQQGQLPPRRW